LEENGGEDRCRITTRRDRRTHIFLSATCLPFALFSAICIKATRCDRCPPLSSWPFVLPAFLFSFGANLLSVLFFIFYPALPLSSFGIMSPDHINPDYGKL
jgi:hypothetical protein